MRQSQTYANIFVSLGALDLVRPAASRRGGLLGSLKIRTERRGEVRGVIHAAVANLREHLCESRRARAPSVFDDARPRATLSRAARSRATAAEEDSRTGE